MSMFPVRPVQTDAQWARNTEKRLRALESGSTSVRIGPWTLSAVDGELVARAPGRSPVILTGPASLAESASPETGLHRTFVVTVNGSPTGGEFTLRFRGAETSPLTHNESAGDIKDALVELSSQYSDLDFDVSGSSGGPWTVIVPNIGRLSVASFALTGGTLPTVTVE